MAGDRAALTRRAAPLAERLASWACELEPSDDDHALARRSLLDTVAVMCAARDEPQAALFAELSEAGRWAALAHLLDYDDLHMPSTAHVSAVCVPAALACGGGARAYLAGAGAMARLGTALGWSHYMAGWHATCTAGAPGAAVAASVARGLDAERTAVAISLAVPAAGGVQRAFGTDGKSLQVAFAVEAGIRAARLAEAGAGADLRALEEWMGLVGGDPDALAGRDPDAPAGADPPEALAAPQADSPAVPGGLAVKLYPCCYALQRPISATLQLGPIPVQRVQEIRVRTPAVSLAPLIHRHPRTGLEGKFSLEYGIAAALLDGPPGLASFSDEAVRRPAANRLASLVDVEATDGGRDLLAGQVHIEVVLEDGERVASDLASPPGAPDRPPSDEELRTKLELCAGEEAETLAALPWESAARNLRARLAA